MSDTQLDFAARAYVEAGVRHGDLVRLVRVEPDAVLARLEDGARVDPARCNGAAAISVSAGRAFAAGSSMRAGGSPLGPAWRAGSGVACGQRRDRRLCKIQHLVAANP